MLVFILANLPLPIIIFLNLQVSLKYLKVHRLARHRRVKKPEQLVKGWWLGNISTIFAFTPAVVERRIFVQNRWWLISYLIAATLSITGLILMNRGLGQEIRVLSRKKR
ncbi:MAG TPA: hypothetical protein VGH44_06680 [Candidatus Saccharimonadia bacterium]|jgi:hypothetical protein